MHALVCVAAVAAGRSLMVPFVRDADRKGLVAISEEVKALAAKVGGSRHSERRTERRAGVALPPRLHARAAASTPSPWHELALRL